MKNNNYLVRAVFYIAMFLLIVTSLGCSSKKSIKSIKSINEMTRLNEKGQQALYAARYQEALEYFQIGLSLAEEENIASFLHNIGLTYFKSGQPAKALES